MLIGQTDSLQFPADSFASPESQRTFTLFNGQCRVAIRHSAFRIPHSAFRIQNGPVVQWIERRFPKPQIWVRSPSGLQKV